MKNLKLDFMNLGNRLVTEHGRDPTASSGILHALRNLTVELNNDPEAREVLAEIGYEWKWKSYPDKRERWEP